MKLGNIDNMKELLKEGVEKLSTMGTKVRNGGKMLLIASTLIISLGTDMNRSSSDNSVQNIKDNISFAKAAIESVNPRNYKNLSSEQIEYAKIETKKYETRLKVEENKLKSAMENRINDLKHSIKMSEYNIESERNIKSMSGEDIEVSKEDMETSKNNLNFYQKSLRSDFDKLEKLERQYNKSYMNQESSSEISL